MPRGGLPFWMRSLLEVLTMVVDSSNTIANYLAFQHLDYFDSEGGTVTAQNIEPAAVRDYINLYLVVAPMLRQKGYDTEKSGIPDPTLEFPEAKDVPVLYRRLTTAVYDAKIILVSQINIVIEKAMELKAQAEQEGPQ